jgi:hypothetical protein
MHGSSNSSVSAKEEGIFSQYDAKSFIENVALW